MTDEDEPGCTECGFNSCLCDQSPNNSDLDYPTGAIENGREFLRRLGEYDREAGNIFMSTDYQEAVRCFEWIVGACERYAAIIMDQPA